MPKIDGPRSCSNSDPTPTTNVRMHVMAECNMPEIGTPVQFVSLNGFGFSGVYFLYLEGEVVYVGQAKNIRNRLGQHIGYGDKRFDSVSCIPLPEGKLLKMERFFIEKLAPRYNRCGVANQARAIAEAGGTLEVDVKRVGLNTAQAAAFLGITPSQLSELGDAGPKFVRGRMPRTRAAYTLYHPDDLIAFKAAA